jgi:hypothetical protein
MRRQPAEAGLRQMRRLTRAVSLDDEVAANVLAGPAVRENISPTILAAATLLALLPTTRVVATTPPAASSRAKSAPGA